MNEKAVPLGVSEWEALSGLPLLQFKLYFVLRWYMSVASQRVGEVRGISLQGLCEELYVEPAPGRVESGSPTKKAVRSALLQLEKHGLVRPCGNGEVLVFFLPKADCASVRQKTKGHKRGTANGQAMGHGETEAPQGFTGEMGQAMGHTQNPIKGHTSEVRVNHPYTEAVAASSATVDKSSTDVLLALPLEAAKVAEWIRLQERRRGCRARAVTSDVEKAAWFASDITPDELVEAYQLTVLDREITKNPAPINVPFLSVFVQKVLNARGSARREVKPLPAAWWLSDAGIVGKAVELGVERRDGETVEHLRGRVEYGLMLAEEAEKQARRSRVKEVQHG